MQRPNLKAWIKQHPGWSALIGLIILINYPFFYFGSPIEGQVVDQDGKPLAGVVAVLQFTVKGNKIIHGYERRTIKGLETLTDDNGHYRFGWWVTPKRPWWFWGSTKNPGIDFYKAGYKHGGIINKHRKSSHWLLMYVRFKPSKERVQLEQYRSIKAQKRDWMVDHGRGTTVWGGVHAGHFKCGWEKFPFYYLEKAKVIEKLKKISDPSEYSKIISPVMESDISEDGCIPAKEFFKQFQEQLDKSGQ